VPVTVDTKPDAEKRLMEIIEERDVDFVVLARYMQVLSDGLWKSFASTTTSTLGHSRPSGKMPRRSHCHGRLPPPGG
jgi:formyltetrahydrofolate deformylase